MLVTNELNKLFLENQEKISISLDNNAKSINEAMSVQLSAVNTHLSSLDNRVQSLEASMDTKLTGIIDRLNQQDELMGTLSEKQKGFSSQQHDLQEKLSSLIKQVENQKKRN